jgi:hypothetical protein
MHNSDNYGRPSPNLVAVTTQDIKINNVMINNEYELCLDARKNKNNIRLDRREKITIESFGTLRIMKYFVFCSLE